MVLKGMSATDVELVMNDAIAMRSISFAALPSIHPYVWLPMIVVLSPAKNLDETPVKLALATSLPALERESGQLVDKLKGLGSAKLSVLMGISPKLAALNHERYQHWHAAVRKPAAFLFDGEAYRGLGALSLDRDDLRFAQRHLRLLSGLYGVLRPLDLIAPHRLEMGTKLAMGRGIKDLYAFWGGRIAQELDNAMAGSGTRVLVNLASEEYFRSVQQAPLHARVITPMFKEQTPKGLRMVAVYAKHQRGAMARWIIRRRILEPDAIQQYEQDGYRYEPGGSTGTEWLFVR